MTEGRKEGDRQEENKSGQGWEEDGDLRRLQSGPRDIKVTLP
jgi:hypothetical protein